MLKAEIYLRQFFALYRIFLIFVLCGIFLITSRYASAQTIVEAPAPVAPVWYGYTHDGPTLGDGYGSPTFATPEAACRANMDYTNTLGYPWTDVYEGLGAIGYTPPRYVQQSDLNLACLVSPESWGGMWAQPICTQGHPVKQDSNTIVCMLRQEAPECEACKEGASPISNPSLPTVGNPIALDGGAKIQLEVNFTTADGMMSVSREYRSRGALPTTDLPGFGEKWRGVLPGRLETFGDGIDQIKYLSSGGSITTFGLANDWSFTTADATRLTLSMVTMPDVDRFTYFRDQASIPNGAGEVKLSYANGDYILFRRANYDEDAGVRYLVPIERGSANGYRLWYDYSDSSQYPFKVRDSLNREMGLTWTDIVWSGSQSILPKTKVIKDIVLPDATTLHHVYGFSAPVTTDSWKDRLVSVHRLSRAGNVLWARTYHYEDLRFAYALTGMSDQNGARLSTYTYDAAGRATSTELAGGVNRETVGYFIDTSDDSLDIRRVVNALGHQTEYTFSRSLGDDRMTPRKLTRIFEPASGSIPERTVTHTYDADGLVIGKTDANGNVSDQENDTAGKRPTSSTDAAGVVTTLQWHPTLDLVLQEVRPGLTVDYGYDGAGQLLSRTETDTTSQTLPYATNGQTRTTSYVWGGQWSLAVYEWSAPDQWSWSG